jgi:predicted DNA-binding transcriptional regulator YafY
VTEDQVDEARAISFVYTNYDGKTEIRRLIPEKLEWGSNQYHPKPGWLLHAWCLDRKAMRTFAWSGIRAPL